MDLCSLLTAVQEVCASLKSEKYIFAVLHLCEVGPSRRQQVKGRFCGPSPDNIKRVIYRTYAAVR